MTLFKAKRKELTAKKTLEALLPQLLDYSSFEEDKFHRLTCSVDKATHAREVEIAGDRRPDWGHVIPAITNLAGIILVLRYEKVDFLTSKALGLLMRSKI